MIKEKQPASLPDQDDCKTTKNATIMEATINSELTTTGLLPYNRQQRKPLLEEYAFQRRQRNDLNSVLLNT